MSHSIHKLSDVKTIKIGSKTRIWQYCVISEGASIGVNCNICSHCFIEDDVKIGNNVTIKNGVHLWNGITIEDNVFIGPNVVFTNDLLPRSKKNFEISLTKIREGASIGANSTVLAGVEVGKYALIGIGSVVTKNIMSYGKYYGNPATHKGWIDEDGEILRQRNTDKWISNKGIIYVREANGLKIKSE